MVCASSFSIEFLVSINANTDVPRMPFPSTPATAPTLVGAPALNPSRSGGGLAAAGSPVQRHASLAPDRYNDVHSRAGGGLQLSPGFAAAASGSGAPKGRRGTTAFGSRLAPPREEP